MYVFYMMLFVIMMLLACACMFFAPVGFELAFGCVLVMMLLMALGWYLPAIVAGVVALVLFAWRAFRHARSHYTLRSSSGDAYKHRWHREDDDSQSE